MWGHDDNIESVAFSPDGRTIATGSEDRSILVWMLPQTTVAQWTAHEFDVRRVIYAPDGTWLASAADDGTIRTWNAETGAMLTSINAHNGSIRSLGVSPSGSLIASGGEDGFIRIWKADTAEVLNEINIGSRANDSAFGVDDSSIVVACEDGLVRMLNVNTGLLVRSFQGHSAQYGRWQ